MNSTLQRWLPFAAWAVTGAGAALALLTVLTIGPFVAVGTAIWTVALVRRPAARGPAAYGALAGPAVVLLYVAWLNRGGPGEVCAADRGGVRCQDEWSPWPWLAAGVLFAIASVVLYRLSSRRNAQSRPGRG